MATRFRKHHTRRNKQRKGLKTRKMKGGNILTNLFLKGKKSPLSSMTPNQKSVQKNMSIFGYEIKNYNVVKTK